MDRSPAGVCGRLRGLPRRLLALAVVLCCVLTACAGRDSRPGVSLILKTQTNPYFVAMKQAAQAEAKRQGVKLTIAAGTQDGDTQNQINEIYTAIARGDRGILVTSNGNAINAALRQAKDTGVYVSALDTPLTPVETADNTFATDNHEAGLLIGKYAAAKLNGQKATIAMLDLYNDQVVEVDTGRDHGFLDGMGIRNDPNAINGLEPKQGRYTGGKGGQYQIVCHRPTQGAIDGGRQAMEQCLSANQNINVVYAMNEQAGQGAYAALKAAGKADDVMLVVIDGSCDGVNRVRSGIFDADSAQYPGKMARLGVDAVAKIARGGAPPAKTKGKNFYDTGTALVTADPVEGVQSQTPDEAAKTCWG